MKVVLASDNRGKIREINQALHDLPIELIPQGNFNLCSADETGTTFVENSIIKARYACEQTGLPAIADDSGLVVDALQGAPGVYSSRFAGDEGNASNNMNKLLAVMSDVPKNQRQAHYQCVMVYLQHEKDPSPVICEATWHGEIMFERRGEQGFGYDPIFWVPEKNCSAAELTLQEKNALSHRGKVLRRLHQTLKLIFA